MSNQRYKRHEQRTGRQQGMPFSDWELPVGGLLSVVLSAQLAPPLNGLLLARTFGVVFSGVTFCHALTNRGMAAHYWRREKHLGARNNGTRWWSELCRNS